MTECNHNEVVWIGDTQTSRTSLVACSNGGVVMVETTARAKGKKILNEYDKVC